MVGDDNPERSGRGRVTSRLPRLPAPASAAAVGILVALLGRVLIVVGEQGCDAARGTSSCGRGWGGVVLVLIIGVMLYAGLRMLRTLDVPEAAVTNAFGLGLLALVTLGLLIDRIFDPVIWVALPVVAAATYAAGAWIAVTLARMGSRSP